MTTPLPSNVLKDLKCVWSGPVRSVCTYEFPRKCISVNPRKCISVKSTITFDER